MIKFFVRKDAFFFAFFVFSIIFSASASALVINQIQPVQVAKATTINIDPTTDAVSARWVKHIGPEWISVHPTTGKISGVTPNVGEAHYIGVKAVSGNETDTMIFILTVGSQNIFRLDGSTGNPATIAESNTMMSGGDVLIIPDGTYSGSDNTFNGNANVWIRSGNNSGYTTWIAENPGKAILPSMTSKGAEYVAYKGLHFVPSSSGSVGVTISGETKGGVNSNHIKVMMSSTQDGGFQATYNAQYILFEDVFAYGDSRAVFRVGSNGNPSQFVIFRRAIARHDYNTTTEPTATFMQYGGDNVLWQNCIAIDQPDDFTSPTDIYGAWETKFGSNLFVKDSIAMNTVQEFHYGDGGTTNVRISNSVFWDVGTGSTANSADTIYDNLTVGDVNAFGNPNNTFDDRSQGSTTVYFTDSIFYDIEGIGTEQGYRSKTILSDVNESTNNLFYPIQSDLTIGDTTDIIVGIDPTDGTPGNGVSGILYPVRIENGSNSDSLGLGATILFKRGASGTLWGETGYDDLLDDQLWPWPQEDEIKNKMAAADVSSGGITVVGARGFAVPGQTLTNYIWGYLGNTVPPLNVQAKAKNAGVVVQWDPPVDLATITGFRIYNVTGEAKPVIPGGKTPSAIVAGNAIFSQTINGLNNGTNYDFVVTAVDSVKGEGSYSYIVSATPNVNIKEPKPPTDVLAQ